LLAWSIDINAVTAESIAVSVQNMDKIRYFYIVASI